MSMIPKAVLNSESLIWSSGPVDITSKGLVFGNGGLVNDTQHMLSYLFKHIFGLETKIGGISPFDCEDRASLKSTSAVELVEMLDRLETLAENGTTPFPLTSHPFTKTNGARSHASYYPRVRASSWTHPLAPEPRSKAHSKCSDCGKTRARMVYDFGFAVGIMKSPGGSLQGTSEVNNNGVREFVTFDFDHISFTWRIEVEACVPCNRLKGSLTLVEDSPSGYIELVTTGGLTVTNRSRR